MESNSDTPEAPENSKPALYGMLLTTLLITGSIVLAVAAVNGLTYLFGF